MTCEHEERRGEGSERERERVWRPQRAVVDRDCKDAMRSNGESRDRISRLPNPIARARQSRPAGQLWRLDSIDFPLSFVTAHKPRTSSIICHYIHTSQH